MKTAEIIRKKIRQYNPGVTFTLYDLMTEKEKLPAAAAELSRLAGSGFIKRYSKGIYYKTEKSELFPGKSKPLDINEVYKNLLYDYFEKRKAYITGAGLYNKFSVTTQIPVVTELAINGRRSKVSSSLLTVSYKTQIVPITEQSVPYLEILDMLKYIRTVPATTPGDAYGAIVKTIKDFLSDTKYDIKKLVKYAMSYNPATRALAGYTMESLGYSSITGILLRSLNPLSKYSFNIPEIPPDNKWNIA